MTASWLEAPATPDKRPPLVRGDGSFDMEPVTVKLKLGRALVKDASCRFAGVCGWLPLPVLLKIPSGSGNL